jgi:hypothetical protein
MDETPSHDFHRHQGDDDRINEISSSYDYARPKGNNVHHRGDDDRLDDLSESVDYARALKDKLNHLGDEDRIEITET